jgi:hypothetical protein
MQWPKEKGQTVVCKALHIKVNIEQNQSIKNRDELRRARSISKKDRQYRAKGKGTKRQTMARILRDIVVFVFIVSLEIVKLLENDRVRGFESRSGQTNFGI